MQLLSESDVKATWQQACVILQLQLSPAVYNTWILSNPLTELFFIDPQSAKATITSPTAFHSTNLKKNLHVHIKQALDKVVQRSTQIEYKVGMPHTNTENNSLGFSSVQTTITPSFYTPQPQSNPGFQPTEQSINTFMPSNSGYSRNGSPRVEELFSQETMQSAAMDRIAAKARGVGLRTDYTFETFAVSTTNEMAHAAATAVSNRPGQSYNPLFLYGGVGVGKTHLMQAIGNNILATDPNTKIIYCTGEEFTNEIVNAIRTKQANAFKNKFRSAQVLLIDDVQFIAGKNAVQEEFFHTFNALTKQLSQIVLTSDRPPHEITLLEDRLRSRFEAGLMIDIQQPSFELRTAILLVKAKAASVPIPIELAKTIAARVESARKIEGMITSIRSEVELKHRQIDTTLIEDILRVETTYQRAAIHATPADIIKTVANHYKVKQTSLKGKKRVKDLVTARHIAMFLLKEELSLSLVEIGKWFSGRDHTSVLHAVNKIKQSVESDEKIKQDVFALRTTLAASSPS